jgi:hypothetical protein
MKKFGVIVLLTAIFTVEACSPTADPPPDTTLVTYKTRTGILRNAAADTNSYSIKLSCGCEFTMKAEIGDTTYIHYDLADLSKSQSAHYIKATIKPGGVSGTRYIDSLIIVTQPPTQETFRDTLRDTLIVP